MCKKNKFTQTKLVTSIRKCLENLPDNRSGTGNYIKYSMLDAGMSAFSVFFMQSNSFLGHQKTMQNERDDNNASSLFGIYQIPSDNHIRNLLDGVSPECLEPVYHSVLEGLTNSGKLAEFEEFDNNILVAIDGVEYFSSQKIHCDCCSTKKCKNGKIQYSHSAITPVIVSPNQSSVIPLVPEFITPQDGNNKQDCELTAAKRWVAKETEYLPKNKIMLGDDLYCHQPFCEDILNQGWHFVLVCKPKSHKTLYEWLDDFEGEDKIEVVEIQRWRGKILVTDKYRFMNHLPLRNSDDALLVNWCEISTTDKNGKVIYHNSFVTDYILTKKNVVKIVKIGRTRWKVENENNNTLKTKGYNLEHNFGHGKQHLSSLLASLNILAYLCHTVLGWFDICYKIIRDYLPNRKTFFHDIKALTRYILFEDWNALMRFMLKGLKIPIPKSLFNSS